MPEAPKPEPIKLEKKMEITQDDILALGVPLYKDMEAIVRNGENHSKNAAEKKKEEYRDKLWKYVSSLTDKNLAAIYRSYKTDKMVGKIEYEYVKYQIINRFTERAFGEAVSVLSPFQTQT